MFQWLFSGWVYGWIWGYSQSFLDSWLSISAGYRGEEVVMIWDEFRDAFQVVYKKSHASFASYISSWILLEVEPRMVFLDCISDSGMGYKWG